jgi:hypothetical protein
MGKCTSRKWAIKEKERGRDFVSSMALSIIATYKYEILMYYLPEVPSIFSLEGLVPQNGPLILYMICRSQFFTH